MRTQDWRASNAPSGPKLTIRCSCGGVLAHLSGGQNLTRDKSVSFSTLICEGCGKKKKARISNG